MLKFVIHDHATADRVMRAWQQQCGRSLGEYRRDRRMSQDDLAERSGISQSTISRIELGIVETSDTVKMLLASALGVEVEMIWPAMGLGVFRAATQTAGSAA